MCPRLCKLHDGQRGFCFVRQNIAGRMAADDLRAQQRLLRGSHREETVEPFLSGDQRAFLRHGGLQSGLPVLPELGHQQGAGVRQAGGEASPEAIAAAARRLGCRSVAFTYNDPVIFAEYAMDMADACREAGVGGGGGDGGLHDGGVAPGVLPAY